MASHSSSRLMLLATVLLVAANLRPAITVLTPLLERIGSDTGLNPAALGALGSVPILAFGVISPMVHLFSRRFGLERTVLVALLILALGSLLRASPGTELVPQAFPLYLGTAILSAGIGVGNVLVPAVVKRDFPDRVPLMTGVYTAALVGAAAVFSGIAVPLADALGWQLALTVPAFLALLAAAGWSVRKAPPAESAAAAPAPLSGSGLPTTVWRQPLAWQVTLFFGLQSTLFYTLLTWLPAIQTSHGINEAAAGLWLALMQAAGVVASLIVGRILQKTVDQRGVSALVCAFMLLALIGIIFFPELMPLWALCAGTSTGCSLLLGLTFITLRARTPRQVSSLSGMAQGIGYLMAALGPVLAGALFQGLGSWDVVLWCVLALSVCQGICGHFAGRAAHLS